MRDGLSLASCLAILLASLLHGHPASASTPTAEQIAAFEKEVRPLLVEKCARCHGPKKQESGLRLDSRDALMRGGESGPAIVPGQPEKSLLLRAVRHQGDLQMPPSGKLKDVEITALSRWIETGAVWPKDSTAIKTRSGEITAEERRFWSFQPVRWPKVPDIARPEIDNPIDRFILARLAERGLKPVQPADRRTLIRRATFDLTGLPPTPDEVEAFIKDAAPDAFAKVVERLLASPAYGERWGRHWLDVVRYADTAGETADYPVPEAYRYRNYVIDAFNQDRPYDGFIREQIAGDILAKNGPPEKSAERIIATGYIALSRRFGFDPENYHHLTIQDTIDNLGQAVMGLSLGCARCHHHKFDPVSMSDYYALYGIFASTRYAFPGSEEKHRPRDFVPLAGKELAYAVSEDKPRNARIQKRGEPKTPGDEVPRRFLEIMGSDVLPKGATGSGRLQLAEWLTRPENPLTARVMVNRIWQWHFGSGLVATENDFGTRGKLPTHPELLDWLAREFMGEPGTKVPGPGSPWSIKKMHRLIMLSAAYQWSSAGDSRTMSIDPESELLWRFPRRRLDAEAIRDAMLHLGGNLDRSRGGAHPFPPVDKWGFTQHAPFSAVYDTNRRSVYLMSQRLRRHPFLALFDGADTNASTPKRTTTTVPTQALFLMNDPFVHAQSEGLARRLLASADSDAARLKLAYRLAYGREPDADETQRGLTFLSRYREALQAARVPAGQHDVMAWAAHARTLLASNEFLFVD
jgi:cytochrome c553